MTIMMDLSSSSRKRSMEEGAAFESSRTSSLSSLPPVSTVTTSTSLSRSSSPGDGYHSLQDSTGAATAAIARGGRGSTSSPMMMSSAASMDPQGYHHHHAMMQHQNKRLRLMQLQEQMQLQEHQMHLSRSMAMSRAMLLQERLTASDMLGGGHPLGSSYLATSASSGAGLYGAGGDGLLPHPHASAAAAAGFSSLGMHPFLARHHPYAGAAAAAGSMMVPPPLTTAATSALNLSATRSNSPPHRKPDPEEQGAVPSHTYSPLMTSKKLSPPFTAAQAKLERLSQFAANLPSLPTAATSSSSTTSPTARKLLESEGAASPVTKKKRSTNNTKNKKMLAMSACGRNRKTGPSPALMAVLAPLELRCLPVPTSTKRVPHYSERQCFPLAIDEDVNWLSEFQCFLRTEILEVFVASDHDAEHRTAAKQISAHQVGIRCRFCAHLPPSQRLSRASAFPSSVKQLYQSFTMMLREHLSSAATAANGNNSNNNNGSGNGCCPAMPKDVQEHFFHLKSQSAQSASDSKRYWIYAAQKLGLTDTPERGMQMTQESMAHGLTLPPFGTSDELEADLKVALQQHANNDNHNNVLVSDNESPVSDLVKTVVEQATVVHLAQSEKIGNRSCLTVGLAGLACRACCRQGRSGLCRVFPARKRNLKTKVQDLCFHLRRCPLVDNDIKMKLEDQLEEVGGSFAAADRKSKVFYSRLWRRMGHGDDEEDETSAPNSPVPSSYR